jgi:hypothetical protein
MNIHELKIGKEYRRIHRFPGQVSQIVRIIKVEKKTSVKWGDYYEAEFIQTQPTERHNGFGKRDSFNAIECERYLRPI